MRVWQEQLEKRGGRSQHRCGREGVGKEETKRSWLQGVRILLRILSYVLKVVGAIKRVKRYGP